MGYQCLGERWGWTGAEMHQGFREQRYGHAITILRSQDRAFAAMLNSYFMLELIRVCVVW